MPAARTLSSPGMPVVRTNSSPGLAAAQSVLPAADIPAAEARQRELEKELVLSQGGGPPPVRGGRPQLPGLRPSRRSCAAPSALKEKLREAEALWHAAPTPESMGLPADIVARAERYGRVLARRDEALARLLYDKDVADEEAARLPDVEPLVRNRNFWLAVAAGVVCLIASFFVPKTIRYVALLDMPAFGFAAMLALRFVEELQDKDRVERRDEMFVAREKKIAEEFEAEAAPRAQGHGGVRRGHAPGHPPAPAAPRAARHHRGRAAHAAHLLEKHPDFIDAGHQLPIIRQQIELLNAKIEQKGSFVRDLREVERELSRLEDSIALAAQPHLAAGAAAGAGVGRPRSAGPGGSLAPVAGARRGSRSPRTSRPSWGSPGSGACSTSARSPSAATPGWSGTGRDAPRVSGLGPAPAAERAASARGGSLLPEPPVDVGGEGVRPGEAALLVEDAFIGVDESRLPLLGRMLKHLGTLTQVLHVTPLAGFPQLSDGTVNL